MVHTKHATDTRKPYSGLSRSLVIAIDVGTTFSGVSYAILEPGEIPKIHGVTRFPGQEHVAGNSKIPSVIYYDKNGNIMAAGAEAESSSVVAQAEDEGWIKAELFKLRLRPRTMQLNMNGMRLTPLPRRKTPVHVFGDYLAYLYRCTYSYITDTHANGAALWKAVEPDIQFVLSHPNGWEGPQQTRMRNAAVYGQLVPDTDAGRARIRFVTEGEASLHACVLSGLAGDVLSNPSKHGFLIADAGGGTLDISAYAIKGTAPLAMEEIAPPDCIFAGSVFVSRRAREFLEEKLKHSKYGTPDSVDHITRKFDETTKRLFRDRNELQFIPFGSPLDKDSAVGIRSGQLRLTGNEVANLFEPSVDAAVNCIKRQIEASHGMIRSVFLVGGYAASPWLFGQLQERLAPFQITVSRPDTQTSKAVADGAIGFYCDHHVSARMSKFMYGVEFLRELDPNDPDHLSRKEKLCELPSGPRLLPDAFDCILARSVKVKESTVFTRKYCTELTNLSMLSVFEVEIWCYRGGNVVPKWINRGDDAFSTLCVVQADLSLLNGSAEPKAGKSGKKYWTIVFSVEIHFGLTEFKARIKWMDNGQVKYGPAVIVYNERGHRIDDDDIDVYPEDDIPSSSRSERLRSETGSRSRTPIDSYHPSTGGSSSRRASNVGIPEVSRIERSSSKGYAPSMAPSQRSANHSGHRGSDTERAGSDSDRRKGKDRDRDSQYREEDKDRGFGGTATPSRNSVYGTPSVAKVPSINGGEILSAGWNANPSAGAGITSRSPSINPVHSHPPSMYGSAPSATIPEHTPAPELSAPPASFVDDHRQSHAWDAPSSGIPEVVNTAYGDQQKSPFVQEQSFDRPKSSFMNEAVAPPARTASPFIDRPKSGIENSFYEKPKSAFGDPHHSVFGDDPPPAMFGDSGPAAETGGADSLFGNPPPSVFDTASPVADSWGFQVAKTPSAETTVTTKSGKGKKKGSAVVTPVATPVVSTPPTAIGSHHSPSFGSYNKSPLGKVSDGFIDEPSSNAVAETWGSKAPSPADKKEKSLFGATRSPFGKGTDALAEEAPVIAAVSSTSPSARASGLWGSKGGSPFDKKEKPLSPLNPASQFEADNAAAVKDFDWGMTDTYGAGASHTGAGDGWNDVGIESPKKEIPREPTPQPEPVELQTPVDDFKETATGKKKKKKGAAATPAKSPLQQAREDAEREAEEAKKAEKERLEREAQEEEARQNAELEALNKQLEEEAEAQRLADEMAEKLRLEEGERKKAKKEALNKQLEEEAEAQRLADEMAEKLRLEEEERKKAKKEQKEKEQKEKEEAEKAEKAKADKEAASAVPSSLFGNSASMFSGGLSSSSSLNPPDKPWLSTDTGGGDDAWGSSWGTPVVTTSKKKKGAKGATPIASTASVFGSGAGTGWGTFGNSLGDDLGNTTTAPSPKTSPKPLAAELSTTSPGMFEFSSGPSLGFGESKPISFGFGDPPVSSSKPPSRAPSPNPITADDTTPINLNDNPEDVMSPTAEGEGAADAEGDGDNDDGFATSGKKKKKKKGGAGTDTPVNPPETPQEEAPAAAPEPAAGGKKKKKKK